uniref:Uncharacterized protein n=1 Tax=Aegilops tauschii TaxID=37682 RepID=M8CJ68_AEGTA
MEFWSTLYWSEGRSPTHLGPGAVSSSPPGSRRPEEVTMRSAQPSEPWVDPAGTVGNHPSFRRR